MPKQPREDGRRPAIGPNRTKGGELGKRAERPRFAKSGRPKPQASAQGRAKSGQIKPQALDQSRANSGDSRHGRLHSKPFNANPATPKRESITPLETFSITPDCLRALDLLPGILDEMVPLSRNHRLGLGRNIRSLWEDLTSEREHRNSEYLSAPAYYSAYLRYFLPWNLLRLSSFLPTLALRLDDEATIIDLGSGPLTLPIALYLSRPELRAKKLTIICSDRTEKILKVGLTLFESLCLRVGGSLPPWTMILRRHQFGIPLAEKADLLTAANVFNEFFWKSKVPLGMRASLTARQLLGYLKDSGSVLLVEPGDPRSGSFISALRAGLSSFGALPLSPCPHANDCPMPGIFRSLEGPGSDAGPGGEPGGRFRPKSAQAIVMPKHREKYPWCHFTIGVEKAPGWLKDLSAEAGLTKEKLVFSYLLSAIPDPHATLSKSKEAGASLRVLSEAFALPGGLTGRYSCSPKGYTLLRYSPQRTSYASGDLLPLSSPKAAQGKEERDEKSGAILLSY
jgi:hypothetical protein